MADYTQLMNLEKQGHKQLSPALPTDQAKPTDTRRRGTVDAHVHARTHARLDARSERDLAKSLHRKLQQKHHLASYTFRFRSEELEDLTKLDTKLEKSHPDKLSKNDLVRLGVNWLLEDYEQHGDTSMLARILAHM
jgi:hypothetical protein